MESKDLCVPIYLNQKIVFDILAMLEDGFSQLSTVTTLASESQASKSSYGGSVGASNVFAFLGITLKGERGSEKGSQGQHEATAEKVHTPASLFFKLRSLLDNQELINRVENVAELENLTSGQFIEFKAILRKNPLFDYVETIKQILEIADLFPDQQDVTAQNQSSGSGKKGNKRQPVAPTQPKSQDMPVYQQMEVLQTALTQSNTLEIIGEMLEVPSGKAVLSTDLEYFNDRNAYELIDGEFWVIGKIVRVVRSDSEGTINLLRKTAFGRFNSDLFDELGSALAGTKEAGIELPEFVTKVEGPAIQVMPMAIFV